MTLESSSNKQVSSQVDESYWAALFEQEEVTDAPPPSLDLDGADLWLNVNQRLDGRLRWPDGEKSTDDPWEIALECFETDQTLQLTVTGYNKGGLIVYWNGLQGFVPASQLIDFPQFHLEAERMRALKQWLNRVLRLKIIEVNRESNRLILSERSALVKAEQRDQLFHEIRPGRRVEGTITNLTEFGAFVDLGGVEGLIHISELSWSRVIHPSHIVQPGQKVAVQVLNVDRTSGRVALSLKRLKQDPWATVDSRYKPGQLVEGVVSNIVHFGAFVLLEEELEGLIHISELAEGTFLHPRNVVQKGEKVMARVLSVDGPAKRLALTLRGLNSNDGR